MLKKIIQLDKFLDRHALLLFLLLLVVALRIPNLTEPYWYGDEGIYLTIGQSLNKGAVLYRDIVDHKTPIIYYLARVHTQLNFRLLLMGWMLISTTLFYAISMKLFNRRKFSAISTALFVFLTTLPWLEGNIPNGELFVIGFVLAGGYLMLKSRLGSILDQGNSSTTLPNLTRRDIYLLLASGFFFGLGILTKVPALFDVVGFGALALISLAGAFSFAPNQSGLFLKILGQRILDYGLVLAGILIPILISVLYFASKGALSAYLQFGLLYNFHYAGNWNLPFASPILQFLFTLPGKLLVATLFILVALILQKKFSKALLFSKIWFMLALFASLLSNRPYPHYFMQLVPPFSLLLTAGLVQISKALKNKNNAGIIFPAFELLKISGLTLVVLILIGVRPYPTLEYYQRWFDLALNKTSKEEYRSKFNYIMTENYEVSDYLRYRGADRTFIWGTNPMLYALSDTWPATRFTVAFHIEDLGVYDETLNEIKTVSPKYIITMDQEPIKFPEFFGYLSTNYRKVKQTDHMSVWIKNDVRNL